MLIQIITNVNKYIPYTQSNCHDILYYIWYMNLPIYDTINLTIFYNSTDFLPHLMIYVRTYSISAFKITRLDQLTLSINASSPSTNLHPIPPSLQTINPTHFPPQLSKLQPLTTAHRWRCNGEAASSPSST